MGGGGFSMEPDEPAARRSRPRPRPRGPRARAAAGLLPRDRERRRAELHRELLRRLRPPSRGEPPPAVHPDARRHRGLPARPGRRLRRRRQHREHARDLARPRRRPRAAKGVGVGGRHDRPVGRIAVLVRDRDDRFVRAGPRRAVRRSRVRAGEPRPALRRRGEPAAASTSGSSPRARSPPAMPPTMAPRSSSAARSWPRSSRRGRTPGRTASSADRTAPPSRRSCRRATWAEAPGGRAAPGRHRRRRASHVADRRGPRPHPRSAPAGDAPSRRSRPSPAARGPGRGRPAARARTGGAAAAGCGTTRSLAAFAGSIAASIDRAAVGRSMLTRATPEDQQVEIELARPPALARPTPELALELLSADRSATAPRSRIRSGRDVERDHGVAELGLVGDADRLGRVQARDPAQARAGERGERPDRLGQRRLGIADVRAEADVGADRRFGHASSIGERRPAGGAAPARLDRCRRSPSESSTRSQIRRPGRSTRWVADGAREAGRPPPARVHRRRRRRRGDRRRSARRSAVRRSPARARRRRSVGRARRPRLGSDPARHGGDRRALVAVAADGGRRALANNRYSADVVAISRVETLPDIPDLPGDNALPRWLEEVAGYQVDDLRRRWRLAIDIDGPLDLVLVGAGGAAAGVDLSLSRVTDRGRPRRRRRPSRRARSSPAGPRRRRWPGSSGTARRGPGRWVEERGLRAASRLAQADGPTRPARPPGSILGALLDRDGPGSLGDHLGQFARRGDRRQPRPPRPPGRCRGGRLARRRGSVRLRPAARRANRRSVAPRAHAPRPRRRRSRSCSVATRSSGRASGSCSAGRRGRTPWR